MLLDFFTVKNYLPLPEGVGFMKNDELDSSLEKAARMLELEPEKVLRWMRLKGRGERPGSKDGRNGPGGYQPMGREEDTLWDEFGSRAVLISTSIRLGMPEGEFVKRIKEDKDYVRDFRKFLDLLYELTPDRSLVQLLLEIYDRQQQLDHALSPAE
jgi:hypothetical protein